MCKVFVITGPSGVGKGTLISRLLQRVPDLQLSVSATTRAPREGERDGRDYYFLSPEEFDRKVRHRDFLEFATYSGHRYGTLRAEVTQRLSGGHSVVLEIEVQGARQVRAAMNESVGVFIAPPDLGVLRQRLVARGTDSAEAIDARLAVAKRELAAQDEFRHRIENDDLDRAVAQLASIVRTELGLPLH
jgi:guanylate kinase